MRILVLTILVISSVSCINESVIDAACKADADCDPPFIVCSPATNTCVHKPLFPMKFIELIGSVIVVILGSLSAAAGIGGGVAVVPLFLLFFGVTLKEAVALSNVIILVNSAIMFLFSIGRKDPLKPTKTLIDYTFVMLLNPIFIFSNVIGSIFSKTVSSGSIIVLFVIVLIALIVINVINGIKKYRQENEELAKKNNDSDKEEEYANAGAGKQNSKNIELIERSNNNNIDIDDDQGTDGGIDNKRDKLNNDAEEPLISKLKRENLVAGNGHDEDEKKLEHILKYEGRDFDPVKYAYFGASILIIFVFSLIKGGKGFDSLVGIAYCSSLYWLITVVMGACCLVLAYYSTLYVLEETRVKKKFNCLLPHEMDYTTAQTIYLNSLMLVVGVVSYMLGLSGGVVTYPVFTTMGMQPLVVSSSSLFMVMLNKVGAVILNVLSNLVIADLAIYMSIILGVSSVFMVSKINVLLKKYKRQSIITLIMVFILVISLIIVPLYAVIEGSKSENFWKSPGICP